MPPGIYRGAPRSTCTYRRTGTTASNSTDSQEVRPVGAQYVVGVLWYVYVERGGPPLYIGGTPPGGHSPLIVTCSMGGGTYPHYWGRVHTAEQLQVPSAEHMY